MMIISYLFMLLQNITQNSQKNKNTTHKLLKNIFNLHKTVIKHIVKQKEEYVNNDHSYYTPKKMR